MKRGAQMKRGGAVKAWFLALAMGLAIAPPAFAALPGEALPQDPLDAAVWSVEDGMGHLLIAAKTGSPLLLQEAEREVLVGLFAGMAAATADGGFGVGAWERVYAAYEHASVGFKELPYRVIVEPGHDQRGFELTLRRHPWLVLMDEPPPGWRVELIESGARLRAE